MTGDSGLGSKLLKKMGWTEGTAIGKSGTGLVVPIKPKLKVGTAGIGFSESERLCSGWWMDAFNKAAAASAAEARDDKDNIDDDDDDEQELHQAASLSSSSGKRRRQQRRRQQLDSQPAPLPVLGRPYAAAFASATVLRDGREETANWRVQSGVEAVADEKAQRSASAGLPQTPSDEDLLAACGGRTAHPAARFGLSLGGKLARVRAQDLRLTAAEEPELPPAAGESEGEDAADGLRKERKRKRRRRERTRDCQLGESEAANA